jgi:glycosyltransferase involved in cell wall biosynthesis
MSKSQSPVLGFILKGYPRISEAFISNEILLLESLGFSIHIFSMRKPRERFCHESVKQIKADVDYLPETIVAFLPRLAYHNFMLAVKQPSTYLKGLKMALRRFSRTRKSATLKHLLQAGYLVHYLLPRKRFKHIHAHFAHSPTSVAMFTNTLSNVPFSFTAHAKDIYTSDKRQLREKISLAEFVVTCTDYNKRYLSKISNIKGSSIHRIYHGIDTELFSPKRNNDGPLIPYTILTVARLTPKKGLPTVYKAIRILKDKGFPVKHILIGDGDDRKEILSLIKRLELRDITQYLGTQPHNIVLDHYRKADLFVLGCEVAPNGDRDGIPNVILESMAMGVPVIATNISAIPEVLINNRTGLLVPPGSPEKMAQAIIELLTENDLRDNIIPKAKDMINKKFNNKELIGDLAALFKDAGV